jgi:hypothetical protein
VGLGLIALVFVALKLQDMNVPVHMVGQARMRLRLVVLVAMVLELQDMKGIFPSSTTASAVPTPWCREEAFLSSCEQAQVTL